MEEYGFRFVVRRDNSDLNLIVMHLFILGFLWSSIRLASRPGCPERNNCVRRRLPTLSFASSSRFGYFSLCNQWYNVLCVTGHWLWKHYFWWENETNSGVAIMSHSGHRHRSIVIRATFLRLLGSSPSLFLIYSIKKRTPHWEVHDFAGSSYSNLYVNVTSLVRWVTHIPPLYPLAFLRYPSCSTGCARNLTGDSGVVSSPHYPSYYPSLLNCLWRITAKPGHVIRIQFMRFELEYHRECRADYVAIYDVSSESVIGRYCGRQYPEFVESTGPKLLISFKTDARNTATGFKATYTVVKSKLCLFMAL